MPRVSWTKAVLSSVILLAACSSATAAPPVPHSPIVLLDHASTGIGTAANFEGQFHRLAISYETSANLTNNAGASVITEVAEDADGPWAQMGGLSPGPDSTDAGKYLLVQGQDGFYNLLRCRIVGTFTSGTVTVKLYFE
jgi:hypothetical protein